MNTPTLELLNYIIARANDHTKAPSSISPHFSPIPIHRDQQGLSAKAQAGEGKKWQRKRTAARYFYLQRRGWGGVVYDTL